MTEQELHVIQELPATNVDMGESAKLAGLRYLCRRQYAGHSARARGRHI